MTYELEMAFLKAPLPPVIPSLMRLRQEDREFKSRLGYITRPYLKNYIIFKDKKQLYIRSLGQIKVADVKNVPNHMLFKRINSDT
jgi:hypothetical protein